MSPFLRKNNGSLSTSTETPNHARKAPSQEITHERAMGWLVVILLAITIISAVALFARHTAKRVAREHADRLIEDAFDDLENELHWSRAP